MSNWYDKKEEEIIERLKNNLESENLQFIGKFTNVEDKDFGFFKDVRSLSGVRKYYPTNEGEPDDFNNRPLEVWSKKTILFDFGKRKIIIEEGKWYKFYAVPAQNQLRVKNRNPFLLQTDLSRAVDINVFKGSELIENIQQDSIKTPESVKGKLTRSIEAISNEINTQPATFIFELIQNADDYPNYEKNVKMSFDISGPYLIIKHNGSQFDVNNAVAICDINEGDKRSEVEKIGFKGIGFKSIFKDCNFAYLKSGDYSFRFDELKWRNEGRKLFWQITPINTYEKEYQNILFPFNNFNLVIKPKESKQLSYYKLTLLEHFKDERILLFLRNVKEIDFILDKDSFSISNIENKWRILKSENIFVEEHIRDELNRGISLNDKRIPLKYQGIQKTEIRFGFWINENKVQNLKDATIYAYLPTKVNLGFGFLLNGNFIPDGSRTHLHQDLTWNDFLFEKAGEHFPNKLFELIDSGIDKSSVINLIPNFDKLTDINDDEKIQFIKAFKKGFDKTITKKQFIPTKEGSLEALQDIFIDETGLADLFGEEFANLTGISEKLIDREVGAEINKIKALLSEYNLTRNIYTINKLKTDLKKDVFKNWLEKPINNSEFLKYLSQIKYLDEFSEEIIFLAQDGALYKGSDLLINLGPDELDIEWLSFKKVLDRDVLYRLTDLQLPLPKYEPILFINKIICKEKKIEIIAGLNNGTISFDDFYSYLSKYVSNPLFPAAEIKSFPIQTIQILLPSWSGLIYFNSNSLNILLSENALPIGLYHLLDKKWNGESNSNLKVLAERLGVLSFLETEPYNFIQTILIAKKDQISRYYLSGSNIQVSPNVTLWSFLIASFDNLSEPQKEGIKSGLKVFPVLSKIGVFKELHTLYMPSDFTDNDALETLSLQFPNSNIDFVSAEYLKHPSIDKTEIRTLFKKLDAKIDTKDFLQHTLIPNLNQISTDLFVPLTRLLYENRDSEPIINAIIRNPNFKLKTKESTFKPLNDCYVGSPYIDETQIPNPFISFPVLNQISLEYSSSHFDAWQKFFSEKLKISDLKNETEIISLKLRQIADNIQLWQNAEASILLLKDIYLLYKSGKLSLNTTNLSYIKKIPLLSKKESAASFHTPNAIHFSSAYKPTFDFEKIFGLDCGVPFLSDSYKFDDTTELIQFFEQIGVTQLFDSIRHSAIYENIPTADGKKKPAKQLFKYVLKKFVGQSDVAFEDLGKYTHGGLTLEDYFGFKSKLDVSMILNYITSSEPNRRELKDLISELLRVYNPNTDRNLINVFISEGKLLSSAKTYNFVRELHSIDESIRSGIRENDYLIDLLFNKQELDRERYLKLFNIRDLKAEDFNPEFDNQSTDSEFTNRVKERLVFFSFDIDSDKYLEIENEFKEKFNDWKIKKCSKISLKYPASNSKIIKEDNRNFVLTSEKIIYYIGNWIEQRNVVIVNWLRDSILSTSKQLQFVQDILLNNPTDIISDFENKGRAVPDEIKRRFIKPQRTQQEIIISETIQLENSSDKPSIEVPTEEIFNNPFKDITPGDEKFIRSIIKGEFELNEKLDAHITAKIKTLLVIKLLYDISEITDEGRFLKAGKDEILVRSAQGGILYLDVYNWGRLSEENVSLSVYTNDKIEIYSSQKQLFDFTKPQNKFGLVRMPPNYTMEDYNSLDKIANKGKWHYIFIVNENTKAAQSYKEVMDYSNPELFKEDDY